MREHHVTMAANGRIVVPSPVRATLGMEHGGVFVMTVDADGSLRLEPLRKVIARVQEEVKGYIPDHIDLAEELSTDRRAESAHE